LLADVPASDLDISVCEDGVTVAVWFGLSSNTTWLWSFKIGEPGGLKAARVYG